MGIVRILSAAPRVPRKACATSGTAGLNCGTCRPDVQEAKGRTGYRSSHSAIPARASSSTTDAMTPEAIRTSATCNSKAVRIRGVDAKPRALPRQSLQCTRALAARPSNPTVARPARFSRIRSDFERRTTAAMGTWQEATPTPRRRPVRVDQTPLSHRGDRVSTISAH